MDGTSPPPPQISIGIGILIGLVSSLIQSLGLTIQRKSHIINESRPEHLRRVEHRRPLWILGFVIFIVSNVLGTIFQVGALPIVILAPLGAISLLYNAVFARVMLGDTFTRYMVFGTVLITSGAILIAIFGVVPEPTHSLEDLVRLFGRTQWVTFLSVLGGVLVLILVITHVTEHSLKSKPSIQLPLDPSSPPSPSSSHPNNLKPSSPPPPSILLPSPPSSHDRTRLLLALSFASVSGCISGLCLLFAKSGVELLILTFSGRGNQFGSWTVAWGGGGLIVLALAQLYYINHALRLASPTVICPLAFSAYNLSSVFGGLIYFDQFARLSSLQLGLVCLGIAVLLLGVGAVSIVDSGTGEGGVDMGVWVEEEEEFGCPLREGEQLADEGEVAREGILVQVEGGEEVPEDAVLADESSELLPSPKIHTGPSPHPPLPQLRNPFAPSHLPPRKGSASTPSSPLMESPPVSPFLGNGNTTQSSPPRRRSSASHRYISLLPTAHSHHHHPHSPLSQQHHPADVEAEVESRPIFSIGLGAASPGFSLRPRKVSHGVQAADGRTKSRHGRSGSESLIGGLGWEGGSTLESVQEPERRGGGTRDYGAGGARNGRRRSLMDWWRGGGEGPPGPVGSEDAAAGQQGGEGEV